MATPNTLFAIINVADPATLEKSLQAISPWVSLKLEEGQWLLIAPSATTTKEVSDRLGITGGDRGSNGIILRVENYFGHNLRSVWEWISTKLGVELGTTTNV